MKIVFRKLVIIQMDKELHTVKYHTMKQVLCGMGLHSQSYFFKEGYSIATTFFTYEGKRKCKLYWLRGIDDFRLFLSN